MGVKLFYYKSKPMDNLIAEIHAHNDSMFVGAHGLFDKEDRRFLAFSYTRPEESGSLDIMWANYYDSYEKYKNILMIKNKYDPMKIFSSNFSVRQRQM